MFSKVLVANRGEIAVRIMQTCREMGIGTVAVYSEVDASSLHVQRADEAYCIGPAPALQSYLCIDEILRVAVESGAQAVHPGYGFLAENADFARAVTDAGLAWIGPPARVIALLGDKVASKRLAEETGVPVIPGYYGEEQSAARLQVEAGRIGYPVMLKAAAGGGGKGMRVVDSPAQMEGAVDGAQREAHSAFGDSRLFLERLLMHPRHIEIQVLLDARGYGIYLGERECTIQRRHQKVLEESPSPVVTEQIRTDMGEAALRLARAAGYTNAGTVEFLFAGDRFYFLEVNTRLQVEHPVTEMVTGLDLVRHQLEIAAGEPLRLSQLNVSLRGHAIEARLYAEDPDHNFLPATGRISDYRPPTGPGIRNDVGVYAGGEITPYYDPILAKLIVHAETRADAVERLTRALARYPILGVTTNLGFLSWVAGTPAFGSGRMDTQLVEREWPPRDRSFPPEVILAAVGVDLLEPVSTKAGGNPWAVESGWRSGASARRFRYEAAGQEWDVTACRATNGWEVTLGGQSHLVHFGTGGPGVIVVREGPRVLEFSAARSDTGTSVFYNGTVYDVRRPQAIAGTESAAHGGGAGLSAPMPGTVVKVAVAPGQRVEAHEPLVVLEAMKMEHVVAAPHAGVVDAVMFNVGDLVPAGAPVVRMSEG